MCGASWWNSREAVWCSMLRDASWGIDSSTFPRSLLEPPRPPSTKRWCSSQDNWQRWRSTKRAPRRKLYRTRSNSWTTFARSSTPHTIWVTSARCSTRMRLLNVRIPHSLGNTHSLCYAVHSPFWYPWISWSDTS